MRAYLSTLNDREKWMAIGGALCLILYGYYLFLYAPLSNKVTLKSTQLIEKIETLNWMNKVRNQNQSSKVKKTINNNQLLTLLTTKLKENTSMEFPYQLQQTGSGDIQLSFDEIPFKLFVSWLFKISSKYTITIKQFDVTQTGTPGVTHLVIILRAG
ncbi:MAG: GspM family type II secretion system protein LspM [Legionellales bacterium]